MNILMVTSEIVPFAKTGGLADVLGSLPQALKKLGCDVRVILPFYKMAKPVVKKALIEHGEISIPIGNERIVGSTLESRLLKDIPVYLVKQDAYYDRDELYTTAEGDYPDNAQRFIFLSQYALEACKQLAFKPDIIHLHDWQTGLIPVYLKTVYADDPFFRKTGTLYTIHNIAYQGLFEYELFEMTWLPHSTFTIDGFEYWGKMNFMKAGINFSDYINTVSQKYSQEIQTSEYGYGIDGVLRTRAHRLSGIMNGVDYSLWNPESDEFIAENYQSDDMSGKTQCKRDLLKKFKLPLRSMRLPLIGIVSRLADQKGFDLIERILPEVMTMDVLFVVLGTGDSKYHALLKDFARKYPAKIGVRLGFDNALAHKIEAGADMFLMASRYEPCGLNQIYSLKYGTVPIVRATGGLDDSIENFDPATGNGNGFKLQNYNAEELLATIKRAVECFRQPDVWQKIVQNGMAVDFSWDASAKRYLNLYHQIQKLH